MIQILGLLNGLQNALPTNAGVTAALQAVYIEISTLITQTSKFFDSMFTILVFNF
jgi:hypothetical protein